MRWHFPGLGDLACKVSLDLEFSLNNSVLGVAAGKLFESVTSGLVDALSRRAKQLYG
jgi:ribosome-associated toxin RatA of RatAB toxin-antitoxin module